MMLNVLQTQLFRLKKSKLFWALFIVCAVLPLIGALFTSALLQIYSRIFAGEGADIIGNLEGGEFTMSVLRGLASLGSNPALFSVICSSIFLSGEFSGGAIRNMVLANKTRTQIFLSFLSVAMIIGVSYLGVSYASALLCYGVAMGFDGLTVSNALSSCFATLFLALLSIAIAQSCVCLFLFSTRKTGATVAFPLLIIILAPSVISGLVELIVGLRVVVGKEVSDVILSWIPLYNLESIYISSTAVDGALVGKIALYNIPLAALFAVFGWLASKSDMK